MDKLDEIEYELRKAKSIKVLSGKDVEYLLAEIHRLRELHEVTQQTLATLTMERDHWAREAATLLAAKTVHSQSEV